MKSEIEVPDGWEVKKLGEISEIRGGKRLPKGERLVENKTSFPYIRVSDFKKGSVDVKNILYLKPEIHEKIWRYTISSNDVYISIAGTIGLVGTISKELDGANLTENAAKLTNLKSITKNFLSYYLESSLAQSQIERLKGKTSQPKLALERIRKIRILIPDIKEQQKIADILSKVDEQIDFTEKIIDKTEELKKGLMQKLLNKGIGHAKFKKTELGEIPEEWKVKKMRDVAKFLGGFAFKSIDYVSQSNLRLFKISNVNVRKTLWDDVNFLPDDFYKEYPEYQLHPGNIVLAMTRPIISKGLKIAKITEKDTNSLLNQRVGKFICKKINQDFLYQIMNTQKSYKFIRSGCSVGNQPNISSKKIESMKIPFPEIEEQKQIASILSKVDEQITDNKKELENLKELKKGLMQDILTGKVRVTI